MPAKYGVLLVGGSRSHQEGYSSEFAEDPRCELIGVTDEPNVPEQRKSWLRELAEARNLPLFQDLDEALRRPDVHIASICVEFERRGPITARCAQAGKHVYVDKPMAMSNEHAQKAVEAVRAAGVKSQMFTMARQAWAARAKQTVESGRIGDLIGMHFDLLFTKGPAGTADLDRPRVEKYPPKRFTFIECKRELFTSCVYSVAALRWIHDRPVKRVFAQTSNYFFREHQDNDVEDFAAISLEFEGGFTATITGGRNGWLSHPSFGPVRVFLIGNRGSQLVDATDQRVEVSCDAPQWRPPPANPDDPMGFWSSTTRAWGGVDKFEWQTVPGGAQSDASYFVDCIEQDRESDVSLSSSAETLRILLAAYESSATGQPVELG